ncbi:MAG: EVE domain-containing protein [Primorskyibacter sp.]
MRYWLFKSEPDAWSWDQQTAKGQDGEEWNGVRNYQARNHMRDMRLGDLGFFYHSQKDKAIVGVVEVCAESHPDSTTDDPRWDCVDIRALAPVQTPVTLAQVKAHPILGQMVLAKNTRLSVQPVALHEWDLICDLAGIILPQT